MPGMQLAFRFIRIRIGRIFDRFPNLIKVQFCHAQIRIIYVVVFRPDQLADIRADIAEAVEPAERRVAVVFVGNGIFRALFRQPQAFQPEFQPARLVYGMSVKIGNAVDIIFAFRFGGDARRFRNDIFDQFPVLWKDVPAIKILGDRRQR